MYDAGHKHDEGYFAAPSITALLAQKKQVTTTDSTVVPTVEIMVLRVYSKRSQPIDIAVVRQRFKASAASSFVGFYPTALSRLELQVS